MKDGCGLAVGWALPTLHRVVIFILHTVIIWDFQFWSFQA